MMNLPQIKVEPDELSSYLLSPSCNYESTGSAYNSSPEATMTNLPANQQQYSGNFQFDDYSRFPTNSTTYAEFDYRYHFDGSGNFMNSYEAPHQTTPVYSQFYNTSTSTSTSRYTSRILRGESTRKQKRFLNNQYPYLPTYSKNTRRSETINIAFAAVRGCIPNVSEDTKLSKIQTLRLAISYMRFLMSCLGDYRFMMLMNDSERDLYKEFFEADKKKNEEEEEGGGKHEEKEKLNDDDKESLDDKVNDKDKLLKGRSRWPQLLWETTLKS